MVSFKKYQVQNTSAALPGKVATWTNVSSVTRYRKKEESITYKVTLHTLSNAVYLEHVSVTLMMLKDYKAYTIK